MVLEVMVAEVEVTQMAAATEVVEDTVVQEVQDLLERSVIREPKAEQVIQAVPAEHHLLLMPLQVLQSF